MRVLGIIPARGGSKGLSKKNIKILGEKPLIAWSIEAGLKSKLINKVIVTSDNNEIIDVSRKYGAEIPFIRPSDLASDTATTRDVLVHAINDFSFKGENYDYIVLLQPTSPFRKVSDIDAAILKAIENPVDMVVAVKETNSNPYYVLFEDDENGYLRKSKDGDFSRRQDCPKVYEYTGSIYVIKVSSLLENESLAFNRVEKYLTEDIHSIDIDNLLDFQYAEFLLENKHIN